ncbi:gliding motility-associated C-terminal domain-containing protein [Fulvivirga sp. 29W222]|uniref:Gliding motility-associated C-terminal domain-containing protein n=1 Tax=Fulvivirga marina TaxID=2494733 RepID=A0A937KB97_9BACT|nr:PKD domain-containing protein [Fulvivirga marina]MBL6445787.1 gliding motility-associated C-terminal domain-containing protein [Fulvivirga marina]
MKLFRLLLICSVVALFCVEAHASSGDPALKYIENKGQWTKGVLFGADIPGGNIYIGKSGFTYVFYDTEALHRRHEGHEKQEGYLPSGQLSEQNADEHTLGVHIFNAQFIGAQTTGVRSENEERTSYNYFYGNDPDTWVSKARAFGKVYLEQLYEGIDLVTYSTGNHMKYDVLVRESGNTDDIKIEYTGVDDISLKDGSLYLKTSVNQIQEYQPYAYQVINGQQRQVDCEYVLVDNVLSYNFPSGYDSCHDLVIDPILIFSTYSGSPADNWGNTATFGENGKLYSGGITNHFRNGAYLGEFPATPGAYQTSWAGVWDIAILKYDSGGTQLEYATYLGGSNSEVPVSLIMNKDGELVIFGITNSTDFPISSDAYQKAFGGGSFINTILGVSFNNGSDMFIAKLSKDGSSLTGSTYFGGAGNDGLNVTGGELTRNYGDQQRGEVFIDDNDDIYITGSTGSTNLFLDMGVPSFERNYGGGVTDAVIAKLSSDLSSLLWGGYLGGGADDAGFAIKVDKEKNVYAAGGTESADFPAAVDGFDGTYNGAVDGWVGLIANTGDSIVTTAFLGTTDYDQAYFLDLDADEDVYILGQTRGSYPVTSGVYNNSGAGQFIHKLSKDLSETIFSTTFGSAGRGEPNISPTAFLVNDCNNLYVAGWGNNSGNFSGGRYMNLSTVGLPTTPDAIRSSTNGQDFYLMVLDSDATSLLYATFFGGSEAAIHVDGGTSRFDKRGIVYHSVCASCFGGSSFPTTDDAWSQVNGANGGCNNAAFKFDLASLRARIQTNSVAFDQPGLEHVCMPDDIVFQNLSIGGKTFEWTFGDGTGTTRIDTTYITHNYKAPGKYKVVLRAIDDDTCIGEDIATTVVTVSQPSFTASDDAQLCYGDELRLTASGGTNYQWISADSTFLSNERTPVVSPEKNTIYYVSMTDSNGCNGRDTVFVEVIPQVVIDFEYEKLHDCFSRPPVRFTNKSGEGDSFHWLLGDGNTSEEDEFIYLYDNDGTYNVTLVGAREFCVYEKSASITVRTVKVPNVITPGVKEHNDTFIIESGTQVHLKILNRWGKLLYEDEDYNNTWDGEGHPSGVYYYEAEVAEETICKGWVHLIK